MHDVRTIGAALRRKGAMLARRPQRRWHRVRADSTAFAARPPLVVTTVPKSGTHLVHQIVSALPGTVDYGTFIATTPSYRRRPRSTRALVRRVRALAPGEIARAHIHHDPTVVAALRRAGAFVVFVHRDPRDVVVSEAHYLSDRAPWHVLHREFAKRTPAARIDLAISGLPDSRLRYEDVGRRFDRFAGWLEDADVVLRFEDLVDHATVRKAVETSVIAYCTAAGSDTDLSLVTDAAVAAIDPRRSHTFREGRVGAWRTDLSEDQQEEFNRVASDQLVRFGYPPG